MESVVTQIDSWIAAINGLLSRLWQLPYLTIVFLLCFAVGIGLRNNRKFPNDAIPWIVVVVGGVFAPMLADPAADDLPLRIWVWKNTAVGIIIGLITWLLHRYALKAMFRKLADKFPWLGWLAPSDGDTQFFVKSDHENKTTGGNSSAPSAPSAP